MRERRGSTLPPVDRPAGARDRRESVPPPPAQDGLTLAGANADLWEIAQQHAPPIVDRDLALALGGRSDNVRVDASKRIITALWHRYPELGPYPFLDSLSYFEFSRQFYPQYRDHVCHQLKVYLLGLGVFHGCSRIHDAIAEQLGGAHAFDLAWLVTSVFHDVGYVIEADDAGPGTALWARVERDYAGTMTAPFHSTGWFPELTADAEVVLRRSLRIPEIALGYQTGNLAADEVFESFAQEADHAGLRRPGSPKHAIRAYFDYAQKVDSKRPRFRDHGVASALMLVRHWHNYDAYIADWSARLRPGPDEGELDANRLDELQRLRAGHRAAILRAAGAMSIHNVTPSLWADRLQDAASAGLDFKRFKISIGAGTDKPNGLAFLLALVDTLQDWDRPTFGDTPRAGELHGEDLSIRVRDGRVHVFVPSDHEEFRAPDRSERSRYGSMMKALTSYLDPADVAELVAWDGEASSSDVATPQFPQTLATLLRLLQTMTPMLEDADATRLIEHLLASFNGSPIVESAVQVTNASLRMCYSIQALDVLGPEAWASPIAFRYLVTQLRHYARANVRDRKWNLEVSAELGAAIQMAITNAAARGLEESRTLFDDPKDFLWSVVPGRPMLEYSRILLWTKEELLSPIATIVMDTHQVFHVPLFFLETPRDAPDRKLDFIAFRCAITSDGMTTESTHGCVNERGAEGRFELSLLQEGGIVHGRQVSRFYASLLRRPELMFAVDARDLARR